jgi:hypothetical protein
MSGRRVCLLAVIGAVVCGLLLAGCSTPAAPAAVHVTAAPPSPPPTLFVPPELLLPQDLAFSGGETGRLRSAMARPVCMPLPSDGSHPVEWKASISGLVLGGDDIPWAVEVDVDPFAGPGRYQVGLDAVAGARLYPGYGNTEYFDATRGQLVVDHDGFGGTIDADFVSDGPTPGDGSARTRDIHVSGHLSCGDPSAY